MAKVVVMQEVVFIHPCIQVCVIRLPDNVVKPRNIQGVLLPLSDSLLREINPFANLLIACRNKARGLREGIV